MSFWDHLRRLAKALTPSPPLSARAEAQRKMDELWDETRWNARRDLWLKGDESATDLPSELDSLTF